MAFLRIHKPTEKDEIGYFAPRTWDFWRALAVCFCLCCILGHWLEMPYCWLMDRLFGIVADDYAVWTDPWYHSYWVYGFGAVFMTLLIEPLKERLILHRKTLWGAFLESLVIAILAAMVLELVMGWLINQPDPTTGEYPFWDNSQLPGNVFGQDDRNLLHLIDRERGTVMVDGVEYELLDTTFPTVDWDDPYRLTEDEAAVIEQLCAAFTGSERLQRHMRFFLDRGSLYKIENGNLMLHACVPLAADGSLLEVTLFGETYRGRALYDMVDASVRAAFSATDEAERKRGLDMLWYLWLGPGSPLFAKSKMATFELYLIADKAARKEVKNPFYSLLDDEAVVDGIFRDFGMDPATSRIICGHVPVKVKDGEDPVKAGGRVLCIDGGFSAAYQKTTGLAGFTLVSNAEGLFLDANEPLASRAAAVEGTADIHAERRVLAAYDMPRTVADTDEGARLRERIALLRTLL